MYKNIALFILLVIAIAEGMYFVNQKTGAPYISSISKANAVSNTQTVVPTASGIKPVMVSKGMKFADSPIFQMAYKIAPGDIAPETKKAMSGFDVTKKTLADGSIEVTLIPKESNYTKQQYTVEKGNTLYFIEATSVDDPDENTDKNLRDDYGVMVDKNGLVL
jgi:hypothetical protein